MNFATTKERIIHYIDSQGISVANFLKKTGIKRGFLDSDKLKASVSDVFIAKIIANYPEININWLITGKGEITKNLDIKELNNPNEVLEHFGLNEKEYITSLKKTISVSEELLALYAEKIKAYEQKGSVESRLNDLEQFNEILKLKFAVDLEIENTEEDIKKNQNQLTEKTKD